MAVISNTKENEPYLTPRSSAVRAVSADAQPTDSVTMAVNPAFARNFVCVRLYDESGDVIVGTAGEFTVSAKAWVSQRAATIPTDTIDATDPQPVDFYVNVDEITVTVTTPLTGVSYWEAAFISNRS